MPATGTSRRRGSAMALSCDPPVHHQEGHRVVGQMKEDVAPACKRAGSACKVADRDVRLGPRRGAAEDGGLALLDEVGEEVMCVGVERVLLCGRLVVRAGMARCSFQQCLGASSIYACDALCLGAPGGGGSLGELFQSITWEQNDCLRNQENDACIWRRRRQRDQARLVNVFPGSWTGSLGGWHWCCILQKNKNLHSLVKDFGVESTICGARRVRIHEQLRR